MTYFTKMHGLGNDMMVINGLEQALTLTPETIRTWGNRHTGVGFDQLMIITNPFHPEADFGYRIFNADGSEVEQCGNGVRCVAQFIHDKKLSDKKTLKLATPFATMVCELQGNNQVTVDMGAPNFDPTALPFLIEAQAPYYELPYHHRTLSFGAVSMGNPHVVFEMPDLAQAEVDLLGTFFNAHPAFPKGVNVGFMQMITKDHIKLRVFERGAGETLACGTGACAAVSIGQQWGLLNSCVRVSLPGGDLTIEKNSSGNILMTGPVVTVFDGVLR
jgi:diaminopimelate epimerase